MIAPSDFDDIDSPELCSAQTEFLFLREKAARFYFKELTGWLADWTEGISADDDLHVDPDVVDLYKLLVETRKDGARAAMTKMLASMDAAPAGDHNGVP